jgi:small-conductance mechanosensitive channel
MADLNEVFEQHKDDLTDVADSGEHFSKLSEKLNSLGYDVLLNKRDKAEFIPASRLNDVISQRDTFKTQVLDLNKQLNNMKTSAEGNEQLQNQLQGLMDQNQNLLTQIENTKIDTELMLSAKDAINPKDILIFVNKDSLKVTKSGEILGIDAEIARVKQERPYLFKNQEISYKKGGTDNNNSGGDGVKFSMNSLIRKASGRS